MKSDYSIDFISYPEDELLSAQILFRGVFLCLIKPGEQDEELKICFYDPHLGNEVLKGDLNLIELMAILDSTRKELIEANAF